MNHKSSSANGSFFSGRKASESKSRAKLQANLRLESLEARMLLDGMALVGGAMVPDVETPAVIVAAGESQPMAASSFEGYNADDIAALQTFLTANNNANGKAVNPHFDALNAATWNVTWTQSSGEYRLTAVNWMDKGVSGALDLSGCENLQTVNVSGNDLTSLDVSDCNMLKQLACVNNDLTELVVNEKIEVLLCDNNDLTALSLTGCDSLEYLTCANNDLTSLNLSDCSMLAELDCSGNNLGGLNVSNNLKLETLLCGDCGLNVLDVTKNVKLTTLDCEENSIRDLDVTKNAELESLWCALNRIEILDISQNLKLNELNCWSETLSGIDVYHAQPSGMRFSLEDAGVEVEWTRDGELVARDLDIDLTRAMGSTAELASGQLIHVQNVASMLEVDVDGLNIEVFWASLPDTNRYQVEYRIGTGRWTAKTVTGTQYALTGAVGKTYEIRVRALDVEDSRYTETETVAFPAQPTLSVPKNTVQDETFQVQITNWAAIKAAGVTEYQIYIDKIGGVSVAYESDELNCGDKHDNEEYVLTNGVSVALNYETGILTFSGTTKLTAYNFKVNFGNDVSTSPYSKVLSVTTSKTTYKPVSNVVTGAYSASQLTVQWDEPSNVQEDTVYTVQYSTNGTKWTTATNAAQKTDDGFIINKLSANTTYFVQVFASANKTMNAGTPVQAAETAKTWVKLAAPSLKATSVGDDNFTITISNYAKDLTSAQSVRVSGLTSTAEDFDIEDLASGVSMSNGIGLQFNAANGTLVVTNVTANSSYPVGLMFFTENVSASDIKSTTVKTAKTAFVNVDTVSAETRSATEIYVDWEAVAAKDNPASFAESYTVKYAVAGTNKWKSVTVKNSVTEVVLTKLSPKTNYDIQVFANKTKTYTPSTISNTAEAETWAKLATPNIKATTVSDDNAKVTVSNYVSSDLDTADSARITIGAESEAFTIEALTAGTQMGDYALQFNVQTGVLSISGLKSVTKYAFGISFFTENVSGSDTKSISFTTTKSAFNNVETLSVETRSATEIYVDWEAVVAKDNALKNAETYTVKYAVAGTNKWKSVTVKNGATEVTLTKLTPDTNYDIQVFANKTKNNTPSVDSPLEGDKTWVKLATPDLKLQKAADDNFTARVNNYASTTLKDAAQVRLTLSGVTDDFELTDLTSESGAGLNGAAVQFDTATGVFTVSGLDPVKSYTFAAAFFTDGVSASDTKSISLKTTKTVFQDVEITDTAQVGETNAISVTWNPSYAKGTTTSADAYSVKYRIVGTSRWYSVTAKNTTSATISNLKLGNKYEIQVFANATQTYLASVSSDTEEVQL